jgi:alpha-beta hydrolase superfamily lysophospholipase
MPSSTQPATAADGTKLLVRRWAPAGPAWASVLLVHGIAEHSGRYELLGNRFAAKGLDVQAYDLRGFGQSGGRRAYIDRWEQHLNDLSERLRAVRSAAAGRPVVLYGHSLGGLIALGYAVSDRPKPDLLVVSAPALVSTLPDWKRTLARVMSRVTPRMAISNDFDGTTLSRDPAVVAAYFADPLNEHVTTARFGAEALAEQARVSASLERLAMPTLVIHGADDALVPASSSEPLGRLRGVTRREYPGLRHELHNEPEGPAVIDDVIGWIGDQVLPDSSQTRFAIRRNALRCYDQGN